VFLNYRRIDTGWAANVLLDALRERLGESSEVFLDNRSISLGEAFDRSLEEGLRRSAVLVVLIGRHWDQPPLIGRLTDPEDWVRREILLARGQGATVVPVLVDRDALPQVGALPAELRFLCGLQAGFIRQNCDRDPDVLADRIAGLLPSAATAPVSVAGVERTRSALAMLLRHVLPPAQQWMGNRARLLDLALAVLGPHDRLVFLAPARINDGRKGSATVFVTQTDILVVQVDEKFSVAGEIRLPRRLIERVETVPGVPLFADVVLRTNGGADVRLQGLFRDQARQLADHLRS